jgi:hypothetical protein
MIQKSWLKFFHWPIFFFLVIALFAAQTTFFLYPPMASIQPNLALLLVLWFALRRDFYTGGILTLLLAHFSEIQSGAPQGFFMISLMLVFISIQGAQRYFSFPDLKSFIFLTALATVFFQILLYGLLFLQDQQNLAWLAGIEHLLHGLISNSITGFFLYRFLSRFDYWTYKDPRKRSYGDEDATLVEEGL